MHAFAIIVGLSALQFVNAFRNPLGKPKTCSWSPLLREDGLACAPPKPKQQTPMTVEGERPGLENVNQKYNPYKDYDYELPLPWERSETCFEEFCVFSNSHYAGVGMSLITATPHAHFIANSPVIPNLGIESTAYYEAEVPGKGMGLIANRTIRKGEIIMQRTPAVLIHSVAHYDSPPDDRDALYQSALDGLPDPTRARFLRQVGDTVRDKIEKNSFQMFIPGKDRPARHLALFPEISKINHDCRPNIHYRITNFTLTTIAVRDIPPGSELTITYIPGQAAHSQRQAWLKEWGFTCTCSQCTLPPIETAVSDARIRQIKALESEIESLMSRRGADSVEGGGGMMRPEMGGKLVELYRAERLDAYMAPAYTRAALIYSMFGNEERAREYATEAVGALERESGPGARDLESMVGLAEDPKRHWSWGLRVTSGRVEVGRNGTGGGGVGR